MKTLFAILPYLSKGWEFIKAFKWPIVALITVFVMVIILSIVRDLSHVSFNKENLKLNKSYTRHQEKLINEKLKLLKENEVLLIQEFKNEQLRIKIIPADDLQHYADSLYSSD